MSGSGADLSDDQHMRPRRSTSLVGSPPAALILADDYRVMMTTMGTIVVGLILVATAVGDAAAWTPWAGVASAIVLLPAWLLLIVRAARSRVAVSTGGIVIRRVFSTRTIAPEDYDGVTWNPTLFPSAGASLAIRRKSGRPVSAPTAMGISRKPLRPLEDEVAEIGKQIAVWLTGPPAGSPPYPVQ